MQGVYRYFYKKLIRPIFTIRSSPHSIALGVAFGLFVALTPTVGFQMLIVVILGTLIKANRIIALVIVWISNPLTFIPMYYGYYALGGTIMGFELWTFENFSTKFNEFMSTGQDQGYAAMVREIGTEIFNPLWLGSLIIAIVAAIPSYPLTRYALRKNREKRQALWREARARHAEEKRAAKVESGRKETISALLIALLGLAAFAGCTESESVAGGAESGRAADTLRVAVLDLDSEQPLFVEFADYGDGRLNYAFLRIYNFSDREKVLGDFADTLCIAVGSDRRRLKRLGEFQEDDRDGTLELLSRAVPAGPMLPGKWTRVPLAYEGEAFPLDDAKIWSTDEKGDTLLPFQTVKVGDWDRFVRNPTLETLDGLKGRSNQ